MRRLSVSKILSLSFIFFVLFSCNSTNTSHEITKEEWRSDLNYLVKKLEEKHINPYHHLSKEAFHAEADSLIQNVPNLPDDEIFVGLLKLLRSLHDSHTGVWNEDAFYSSFPVKFFVFNDDEIRLIQPPKDHPELLGAQLMRIDEMKVQQVCSKVLTVIQFADNEYSESERLARYLKYSKVLNCLGITEKEETAEFTFLLEDGSSKTIQLKAGPIGEYTDSLGNPSEIQTPFSFENATAGVPYLWYQIDPTKKLAYLYFAGYPTSLQMQRFALQLSRNFIKNDVQKLIIDLRDNGGGNFYNGLNLIKIISLLDQIQWKNGIYALTSRLTYSAGMSNTAQVKELLNAKIVGEPTGSNPNAYQDAEVFQLPHSGLYIQYSKRYYQFQDSISDGIIPDVYIKPSWEDFKKGNDAQLQWILNDIQQNK